MNFALFKAKSTPAWIWLSAYSCRALKSYALSVRLTQTNKILHSFWFAQFILQRKLLLKLSHYLMYHYSENNSLHVSLILQWNTFQQWKFSYADCRPVTQTPLSPSNMAKTVHTLPHSNAWRESFFSRKEKQNIILACSPGRWYTGLFVDCQNGQQRVIFWTSCRFVDLC